MDSPHSQSASSEQKPRSRLTRAFIETFAIGIENGSELPFLARAAGFSPEAVQKWIEIGRGSRDTWPGSDAPVQPADLALCRELHEAVERARAARTTTLMQSFVRAATTVNPKTLQPDWRAADAYLSKHPLTRQDWHESDKALRVTHIRSPQDALAEAFDEASLDQAASALALPTHIESDHIETQDTEQPRVGDRLDG